MHAAPQPMKTHWALAMPLPCLSLALFCTAVLLKARGEASLILGFVLLLPLWLLLVGLALGYSRPARVGWVLAALHLIALLAFRALPVQP